MPFTIGGPLMVYMACWDELRGGGGVGAGVDEIEGADSNEAM